MTLGFHDPSPGENLGNLPLSLSFCGRLFSKPELELMREMARDYARLGVT
jgi:hypothetical protein